MQQTAPEPTDGIARELDKIAEQAREVPDAQAVRTRIEDGGWVDVTGRPIALREAVEGVDDDGIEAEVRRVDAGVVEVRFAEGTDTEAFRWV